LHDLALLVDLRLQGFRAVELLARQDQKLAASGVLDVILARDPIPQVGPMVAKGARRCVVGRAGLAHQAQRWFGGFLGHGLTAQMSYVVSTFVWPTRAAGSDDPKFFPTPPCRPNEATLFIAGYFRALAKQLLWLPTRTMCVCPGGAVPVARVHARTRARAC
jgi:hypothetical protein